MSLISVLFNHATLKMRSGLQQRITDELLFDMPTIGMDPAIILGATRATALIAKAAFDAGHKRFLVIGGKEVGNEDPRFTRFLEDNLAAAELPLPSNPKMKEHEYGREVLRSFGVPDHMIFTRYDDRSTNLQQNLEVLKASGYQKLDSLEVYTLAGTARRVLGTARKVLFSREKPIAAHNVFPHGIARDNWMDDSATSFYALSEADKILPGLCGGQPKYEKAGFCKRVELELEIERVRGYIRRMREFAGPKAGTLPS